MLQITETEIKKRLAFDNPWWEDGAVGDVFRNWPRRSYFEGFMRLVGQADVNRAVVLMGPRRVGKTVMLTQAIQELIDKKIPAKLLCYVSVDTPTYTGVSLERLLRWFMEMHGHDRSARLFVFFDEIQYHADWERHLKSLVDSFPGTRFVASGSAAAALKMKSDESGAGRFTDFLLPPLNFSEFLRFSGRQDETETDTGEDIGRLNDAFVDYINFGAFPEAVIKAEVRAAMSRFVANDIVDKVLLRDLPSLYGIADTQELKRFFTVLAYNTGMEVSFEGLAQASGVAKNTIKKYLDYLEAAFLVHRLHRLDQDGRRFRRVTHFKVYLSNPSIRTALFGAVDAADAAMGPLAETAFIAQIAPAFVSNLFFYARWKGGEVDFVWLAADRQRPLLAKEIKWSDRPIERPGEELKALVDFCRKCRLESAYVHVKSRSGTVVQDGIRIEFSPLSKVCKATSELFAFEAIASRDPQALRILRGLSEDAPEQAGR